jgi:hypothetical protein
MLGSFGFWLAPFWGREFVKRNEFTGATRSICERSLPRIFIEIADTVPLHAQ